MTCPFDLDVRAAGPKLTASVAESEIHTTTLVDFGATLEAGGYGTAEDLSALVWFTSRIGEVVVAEIFPTERRSGALVGAGALESEYGSAVAALVALFRGVREHYHAAVLGGAT